MDGQVPSALNEGGLSPIHQPAAAAVPANVSCSRLRLVALGSFYCSCLRVAKACHFRIMHSLLNACPTGMFEAQRAA